MEEDYAILGLPPNASATEVRAAYRRLARRYHPDTHPADPKGAAVRFEQITAAYVRLRTETRGSSSVGTHRPGTIPTPAARPPPRPPPAHRPPGPDPRGEAPERRPSGTSPPRPRPRTRGRLDTSVPFDWSGWAGREGAQIALGDAFARGNPYSALKVEKDEGGGDVSAFLDIAVRESLLGAVKRVVLLDEETCRVCHGSGKVPPRRLPCAACSGTGRQEETHLSGAWKSINRCSRCKGSGVVEHDECSACAGKGKEARHDIVMVEVPPGSPSGRRIRIAGLGRWDDARRHRGDYYLTLRLAEGPESWTEEGAFHEAFPTPESLLRQGGKLVVPAREGPLLVEVAAGTSEGHLVRLPDGGPRASGRTEPVPLVLHLKGVEDPGDLSRLSIGIPAFLRKSVPTEPGEEMVGAWSACLDSPDNRGFFIVTSRKVVFLSKENLEGIGMEWFSPLSALTLAPIRVPPDTPRDRSADWAITVAPGRKVFLRRSLAQIEKLYEVLQELKEEDEVTRP